VKMKNLIRFIERSNAFDNNSKLKAILLASGVKPNTYVHLRIEKNLHDKHEFERLLKLNKIEYAVSRAKGFEEITSVTNKAKWKLKGTWYGYDLFKNKKEQERFKKYVGLVKRRRHAQSDKLAGSIYGYPSCCINKFIQEHDTNKLVKKYSYYDYYKRLHDSDKAFPFIAHTPCTAKCKRTKTLNAKYKSIIKKLAPQFYKKYSRKRKFNVPVIVDIESDGIWKKKDAYDYILITQKPIEKKYQLVSWLTKKEYARGTVLQSSITLQYDYATVRVKKKIKEIKNFHHERKFSRP